jgi:hypothetical protein
MKAHFGTGANDKLYSEPGKTPILTQEGVVAVDEAITFLQAQSPIAAM